jgi:hypothetical protein
VSAEGELFLRNLAVGFERCFARAVYTQLRRGHAMGADDVARTLRVCGGFASDIDITQYLRVQRMHFLSLQRAIKRRGSLQEQPDGFPAHDDDDDADEDEDGSVSSTGSEQLAAPDEMVRPQAHKRVDEARAQFRSAVLEHFVPLAELVLPTSEAV